MSSKKSPSRSVSASGPASASRGLGTYPRAAQMERLSEEAGPLRRGGAFPFPYQGKGGLCPFTAGY